MKKTLSIILALVLALTCLSFAAAEEAAGGMTGYLMYADAAWAKQYWGSDVPKGVTPINAVITGEGEYTVGLEFAEPAEGLAFTAVGIDGGEIAFPNYTIELKEIRVNGTAIETKKGYTSSDDGITTRMNIYNEWVGEVPSDARSFDGKTDDTAPVIVDKEAFASVTKVEADFVFRKNGVDTAYLMYADAAWAKQYWSGDAPEGVTPINAVVDHFGDYTVGLEFAEPAEGLAFTAVGIVNGEKTYPGAYIKIKEIRVNGEAIEAKKGYTSSDDGITTRMNIYNEWVSEVPSDARSFDGTTEDAAPVIVDKELFASVSKVEVDFTLVPVTDTAYLMYADAAWAKQYWGSDVPEGVTAKNAVVDGQGTYTVGLEFAEPAEGLAFTAVGVVNGEKTFGGYFIDITDIKVNGESIKLTGTGFTTSDDGICTRENIYNEWVTELPKEARRADGQLEGASAVIVDKEAFASVTSVEVTFDYIYGKPAAQDDAPLTEEEAAELQKVDYNAYIGVQTENYIFRNTWDEASYGRDSQDNPECFGQLTGWDESNNKVNYGGTFEDVLLTKDGTYTVSLTTGEMGFGSDTFFRMLFVSTEIPSKLVRDGYVTISDVKTKIGSAATQDHTELDTSGEYARIIVIDEYKNGSDNAPFGYNVPGADTTITITFTVTGLTE